MLLRQKFIAYILSAYYICNMRTTISIILVLITTATLFAAQAGFEYLTAKSNGRSITVEWRTTSENGISRFLLERAADGISFTSVTSIDAKGAQSIYRYVDEDALMKGDNDITSKKYVYRIKIIGNDNSLSYSDPINVTHNVSGIRRTWGMIKEMFR